MIHTAISIFHDYHCPILRNSFPPVRYAPVQFDWVPVRLVTQSFWGTQSTSHDWNWCISTSHVFETRIFLSSNFKKLRKSRFYWWSSFVYLFMIEVLNDVGLLKRIYVFWSKGDPVGDWNWCIPTCRVFETRIFVSSNFKKWENIGFIDEVLLYTYLW